jgi:hypothetical protein
MREKSKGMCLANQAVLGLGSLSQGKTNTFARAFEVQTPKIGLTVALGGGQAYPLGWARRP